MLLCSVAVDGLDLSRLVHMSLAGHELFFLNGLWYLTVFNDRLESVLLLQARQLAVGILLVSSRVSCVDHIRRDVSECPPLLILRRMLNLFYELER